jgi:hypothetical protein
MAKLFVSGYADWWANEPHLVLSVEADTGKPVNVLNEKHFTVGTLGSGAQYGNVDVTSQFEGAGPPHGFYQLGLDPPLGFGYWPAAYSDVFFGVEVVTDDGDRGQTIVANQCGCEGDGTAAGRRR